MDNPDGCKTRFHAPCRRYKGKDHDLLIPNKYITIKDDTPGFYLNDVLKANGEPATLPDQVASEAIKEEFKYEVPMSLNAEICMSEFRNVEKPKQAAKSNHKDDAAIPDMSDILFNVYSEATKEHKVVKKIRRMKSSSPPRVSGKSPSRHKSPPRVAVINPNNIITESAANPEQSMNLELAATATSSQEQLQVNNGTD